MGEEGSEEEEEVEIEKGDEKGEAEGEAPMGGVRGGGSAADGGGTSCAVANDTGSRMTSASAMAVAPTLESTSRLEALQSRLMVSF